LIGELRFFLREIVSFGWIGGEIVEFEAGGVWVDEEFPTTVAGGEGGAAIFSSGVEKMVRVATVFPKEGRFSGGGVSEEGGAEVLAIEGEVFG